MQTVEAEPTLGGLVEDQRIRHGVTLAAQEGLAGPDLRPSVQQGRHQIHQRISEQEALTVDAAGR